MHVLFVVIEQILKGYTSAQIPDLLQFLLSLLKQGQFNLLLKLLLQLSVKKIAVSLLDFLVLVYSDFKIFSNLQLPFLDLLKLFLILLLLDSFHFLLFFHHFGQICLGLLVLLFKLEIQLLFESIFSLLFVDFELTDQRPCLSILLFCHLSFLQKFFGIQSQQLRRILYRRPG